MSKQHENEQKVLHNMKVNNEKAIEVNNELKVNVYEQQDYIKYLKEQFNRDDEDEVQEITTACTPMNNNKPVRGTCNQTFAMENWFKNIFRKSK